jgi:hypothetical protein
VPVLSFVPSPSDAPRHAKRVKLRPHGWHSMASLPVPVALGVLGLARAPYTIL